jgi:hypothetical protein
VKLKMWTGNLDGSRQGLVIAPTKARAREIVGVGRTDFDGYWRERSPVDTTLEPEVLYTRRFDPTGVEPWFKGRCPL